MGFCKFNEITAGTAGTPSPTCHCKERSDAAIRSFPARRRIPTPVTRSLARNDRKREVEGAVPYGVQQSYGDVEDAVPYNGSSHPSAGGDAHTSPRRTNAHFAAGHMGPALQGTPVMQDGTSGRRPLQRLTAPVRRGRCPHIAPPDKCTFCGGTHGSRPTGYAGHAGRDVGTPSPTTAHRTHPQGDDAHTSPRQYL